MAKGDSVNVLLDIGAGQVEGRAYVADKAGRTVEYDVDRKTGNYVIEIKGRAGGVVRTAILRGDRVIAIEETPA